MVNRTSAWAPPAAVLLALQLCTGSSGAPLEDGRALYAAADYPQVSDPATRWDRLATTPGAGVADFLIGRLIKRQFAGMVPEMHRRADGHQTRRLDGPNLAPFSPPATAENRPKREGRLRGDFTLVV